MDVEKVEEVNHERVNQESSKPLGTLGEAPEIDPEYRVFWGKKKITRF